MSFQKRKKSAIQSLLLSRARLKILEECLNESFATHFLADHLAPRRLEIELQLLRQHLDQYEVAYGSHLAFVIGVQIDDQWSGTKLVAL